MIPHAASTLVGTASALVVTVVSLSFRAGPMFPAGLPCRPLSPLLAAGRGAVDVPAVAPPVDPEDLAAVLAWSCSNFQWSSARPKNWTSPPLGRILATTVVTWSGVRRFGRCPKKARSGNSGPSFYLLPSLPVSLAATPVHCQFLAYLAPWAPVILMKTGPRHAGGDTRRPNVEGGA